MRVCISVIGRWRDESEDILTLSGEVGQLIARRGAVLITGGGPGTMEAASRGAKKAGGVTIGFLAGSDYAEANPYIDVAVPTGTGFEIRSALAIRASNAVIMVGGGNGTLGELSMAYLHHKPVVVLSGSGGWADRLPSLLFEGKYLDERRNVEIHFVSTPAECVDLALALIEGDCYDSIS